ncbi:MAG: hypothetical protein J5858_02670 [Lentisphaeria bacterium]|nr:hypothetical protein [Lentisphaeria bacterium]
MIPLAIFLENARKAWNFSLDAAWDQNRRHPELSRGRCLRERSFLRTLLGSDQVPVFGHACVLADSVTEKEEMDQLLPQVLQWMEKQYPPPDDHPEFEPGRSFRYGLNEQHFCYLHIRNAKQPESFLEYPEYVADDLRYIMDKAEQEDSCDTLYTASWLNSLPAFLRFFPREWTMNLSSPPDGDFGPTLGWQGQFINRAGLLNEAAAAKFLRTGILPYARLESHCSFESVRRHLNFLERNA